MNGFEPSKSPKSCFSCGDLGMLKFPRRSLGGVHPASYASKDQQVFLFDLPLEIIDNVVSHIISIPDDPRWNTFPGASRELFPSCTLHVNQCLRDRTTKYIAHNCLWIEIDGRTWSKWTMFRANLAGWLLNSIPPIYAGLLATDAAQVTIFLSDQMQSPEILQQNKTIDSLEGSLIFPFNYHSFAHLCVMLTANHHRPEKVHVDCCRLMHHRYLQKVASIQILPMGQWLRFYMDVELTEASGDQIHLNKDSNPLHLTVGKRTDVVMALVKDLDRHNRVLEATIMCMYIGYGLVFSAAVDPSISSLQDWLASLADFGWQSNRRGLERMRLIRTLFFIDTRALFGFVSGRDRYGIEVRDAHFYHLKSPLVEEYSISRQKDDPRCSYFGLPDHELASHYYALSLLFPRHLGFEMNDGRYHTPGTLKPYCKEIRLKALYYTFCAWNLDRRNLVYARSLDELMNLYYSGNEESRLDVDAFLIDTIRYTDIDGEQRARIGHDKSWGAENLKYLSRAQYLAREANVAYDKRRGDELPVCESGIPDAEDVRALLNSVGRKDRFDETRTALKWETVGLCDDDVLSASQAGGELLEKFAPWGKWTPM